MNNLDDELRRILSDDRLSLTARADAVGRIVKGARRRHTTRVVASAVGSVGLVAAVTVGSVAVTGQFSAAPDMSPADTPTTLETRETMETPETVESPETEATEAAPPAETEEETGTETGEDADADDPAVGRTVVYPSEGIDGFTVGTKLSDLENIDGVEITRFSPEDGYSELCYGEYRSANAHGFISTRGTFGTVPDDLDPYYEVSTMHFDLPVATPEGITAGSAESAVLAAYPDAWVTGDGTYRAEFYGENVTVRAWHFLMSGGKVAEVVMDGAPNCRRRPIVDPPTDGGEQTTGTETG